MTAAARFLVPNVLYEPERRFKALKPEDYSEGPTFMPNLRVFLFRKGNSFRAASAVCTHLGCTVPARERVMERFSGAGAGAAGRDGH